MIIDQQSYDCRGLHYIIRSAVIADAQAMSQLRVQIDGETEYMDRERGEAYLSPDDFERVIKMDTQQSANLFLVAEAENKLIGYARCEGSELKRLAHRAEFGIGVCKAYWGFRVGTELLRQAIAWADANDILKLSLSVLECNTKALMLYEKHGFEIEGRFRNDKRLADGRLYDTIVMGRLRSQT